MFTVGYVFLGTRYVHSMFGLEVGRADLTSFEWDSKRGMQTVCTTLCPNGLILGEHMCDEMIHDAMKELHRAESCPLFNQDMYSETQARATILSLSRFRNEVFRVVRSCDPEM